MQQQQKKPLVLVCILAIGLSAGACSAEGKASPSSAPVGRASAALRCVPPTTGFSAAIKQRFDCDPRAVQLRDDQWEHYGTDPTTVVDAINVEARLDLDGITLKSVSGGTTTSAIDVDNDGYPDAIDHCNGPGFVSRNP